MYGYAQDIDLIQDGQLSEVRMHGKLHPFVRLHQPGESHISGAHDLFNANSLHTAWEKEPFL